VGLRRCAQRAKADLHPTPGDELRAVQPRGDLRELEAVHDAEDDGAADGGGKGVERAGQGRGMGAGGHTP
jgi:hypothetical protein